MDLRIYCSWCNDSLFKIDKETASQAGSMILICRKCRGETRVSIQSAGKILVSPGDSKSTSSSYTEDRNTIIFGSPLNIQKKESPPAIHPEDEHSIVVSRQGQQAPPKVFQNVEANYRESELPPLIREPDYPPTILTPEHKNAGLKDLLDEQSYPSTQINKTVDLKSRYVLWTITLIGIVFGWFSGKALGQIISGFIRWNNRIETIEIIGAISCMPIAGYCFYTICEFIIKTKQLGKT